MTRTKAIVAALLIALAAGSTAWFASGGSERSGSESARAVGPSDAGVTATLPTGWSGNVGADPTFAEKVFNAYLDQGLDPLKDPGGGDCTPKAHRTLALLMTEGGVLDVAPPPEPRPERFTSDSGRTLQSGADGCDNRTQIVSFTNSGRTFVVQIAIGRDVTSDQLQQAYSMLDGLQIERRRTP
jgi:hypothetical protein